MDEFYDLEGRVAVVTGGGGVLCGTICKALAERGVKVVILDIDLEAAQKNANDIMEKGGQAIAVKADVLSKESLNDAYDAVIDEFGEFHILINGAGGNKKEATTSDELSFFDLPEDAVKWVFDLNFMGTVITSQVFGRFFVNNGEGVIINVSSMAALCPLTRTAAYSPAKAAVSNFTQWLAVHMSDNYSEDIRVNAIAPGFLLTEQNRFLLTEKETGELTPRGKTIIDHTPMDRFGDPEDLLGAVIWLVSPSAKFVHGAVIPIDGGFAAFSGV